jgi:hypothetical protein
MSKKGLHERDRDYCYGHGVTANAGCFAQATEMTTYSIPPAANLTGKVVKKSEYAVAGGAFSDVWMGEYEGRVVAIKCPRLVNVTVDKLNQVSPHNLHVGSGCVWSISWQARANKTVDCRDCIENTKAGHGLNMKTFSRSWDFART